MKLLILILLVPLSSCHLFSNQISEMTCAVNIQEKAGGENPSKIYPGSEVKAIDFENDNKVLVSTYDGERFAYTVYAEKTKGRKVSADMIFSFSDKQEQIKVWSPQAHSSSGQYSISLTERGNEQPIYYLNCNTK